MLSSSLVVTVGNALRSDDGAGPYIAGHCKSVIDAGERPERIVDRIIALKPKRVVFIDAADFQGFAGEVRVIDKELLPKTTLTTHMFPLPAVAQMITADCGAEVFFLGIQAKSFGLGEGLSAEAKESCDSIIKGIKHA